MHQRNASGVVDLLRENMVLRAELEALAGILDGGELTGQLSSDWRTLLKNQRTTQIYRATVQQYDDVIRQVSEASSRAEIDRLLGSVELHSPLK